MLYGIKSKLEFDLSENRSPLGDLRESLLENLNCLVVCISHSWGGLEKVAASDSLDLGSLGFKVSVLCLEDSPIHKNLSQRKEVETIPLDFVPRNYFDFKMRGELFRLVDGGVNLIHTHQPSLLGSIVPWLWSKPKVALLATRHIMNNHNKKDFIHRAIYSRLDSLIVMSQTLRRNVAETHTIREKDLRVIPLGLDFSLFNPDRMSPDKQRAAWGIEPNTTLVGLVGRIDPAKGQATFISAAAGLLKNKKSKENLKFIIVGEETLGSENQHLAELKKMISQFRLEDSVIFSGYQDNIPEVMSALDIFVMPSRQEAFGLVAIEAMAMRCPVIISSGGSAEEIVGNEEFGLMVRPDDAFDLQRQIRYLLDHPAERVLMGKKARDHVVAKYDRRNRVIETLQLYHRSLRRRRVLS